MKLDVGCGNRPKGDVNVDLYIRDTDNHRNNGHDTLHTKLIPNFVCCDGCYLPFVNGAFTEVFSAQVIEHVPHPQAFLKELRRVATKEVTVETAHRIGEQFAAFPHPYRYRWLKQHHISKMTPSYLKRIAEPCGLKFVAGYTKSFVHFPTDYVSFFRFPYEIGAIYTC